jgi:O-antigen/teichoic acid export membrane protein
MLSRRGRRAPRKAPATQVPARFRGSVMWQPGESEKPEFPTGVQRVVARNLRIYGGANVAIRVVSASVVVVLARTLSETDFGRYSVAVAVASLLTRIVELGFGAYMVREATQRPADTGQVVGHVLILRTALSVVAVALCAVVAALLSYDSTTFATVLLLAVAYTLSIAAATFSAVLISLERARDVGLLQMGEILVLALATLAAAVAGAGPVELGIVALLVSAAYLPVAYLVMARQWRGIRFERRGMRHTLATGSAYSGMKIGYVVLTYLDSVMVQAFRGNVAAGLYGAAYRLLVVLMVVPYTYNDAALRSVSHLAKQDRGQLQELFSRTFSHLVFLALPIGVGGAVLSESIMRTLFGPPFAEAGTAAALLLVGLVFAYPNAVQVNTALTLGRERLIAMLYGGVVLSNAIGNIVAIPALGIDGAALVMLCSQVLLVAGSTAILRSAGVRFVGYRRLGKAALATGAMLLAVVPLRDLPLPAPILAGAAIYIAALLALRTLDEEDWKLFPFTRRRLGDPAV